MKKTLILLMVVLQILAVYGAVRAEEKVCYKNIYNFQKIASDVKKEFYAEHFVVYGDIKKFDTVLSAVTDQHLAGEVKGVGIYYGEGFKTKMEDAKGVCEYFSKLIVAGGDKDATCDITKGGCDYFKCTISNEYKDQAVAIIPVPDEIKLDCIQMKMGGCTKCAMLSYRQPLLLTLSCADFNNCENELNIYQNVWKKEQSECKWYNTTDKDKKWYAKLATEMDKNYAIKAVLKSMDASYGTCKSGDSATYIFDVNDNDVDIYLRETLVIDDALLGKDKDKNREFIFKRIKGYDVTFKPAEGFAGECGVKITTGDVTFDGFDFEGFANATAICFPTDKTVAETVAILNAGFKNNKQDTNDESKQKCEVGEYWNATVAKCVPSSGCFKWQIPDDDQMLCVNESEDLVNTDGDIYPDKYDLCPDKDNEDLDGNGYADACDAGSNTSSNTNVSGAGVGADDGGCALISMNAIPNLGLLLMSLPVFVIAIRRKFN